MLLKIKQPSVGTFANNFQSGSGITDLMCNFKTTLFIHTVQYLIDSANFSIEDSVFDQWLWL